MIFFRPSLLTRSLSFVCSPSSSLRNTTKLPILCLLLSWVAASSFLTRLVKLLLVSRAKTMATGFPPFCQTRQFFLPSDEPLQFSGWNGVMFLAPTCGPDLRSAASSTPPSSSAPASEAPVAIRTLIVKRSSDCWVHSEPLFHVYQREVCSGRAHLAFS